MSVQTNPKVLIRTILHNNIVVKDTQTPTPQDIPGRVVVSWYDEELIGEDAWLVTIGPTIAAGNRPQDIGGSTFWENNVVQIDLWVPNKKDSTANPLYYKPKRVIHDLKEAVKGLLQAQLVNPAADVKYLRLSNWRDIHDPEHDILRVSAQVTVEWEE
jgi:hypothetical protein